MRATLTVMTTFRPAALVASILVLPLVVLEVVNQGITARNTPGLILMFALLWLLAAAFIVILVPIVRAGRAGSNVLVNPARLLFRVVLLDVIAGAWTWMVADQLPCFLGVPNCD